MGARLRPVDFGPLVRIPVSVTAGAGHTCVVLQPGGGVRCWGRNTLGQLNAGDTDDRGIRPGQVSGYFQDARLGIDESAVAVAAGVSYTCVILVPGNYVKCWGANTDGVLGSGFMYQYFGEDYRDVGWKLLPVDVGYGLQVETIAAGGQHVCVKLKRSSPPQEQRLVKCWGRNSRGQLGLGDTADRGDWYRAMGAALPPVDLGPPFANPIAHVHLARPTIYIQILSELITGANQVSTGSLLLAVNEYSKYSTGCLARTSRMGLQCWGWAILSHIGPSDLFMMDIGSGFSVQSIAMGVLHTCVLLKPGGVVKCWGYNFAGQLGLGLSGPDHYPNPSDIYTGRNNSLPAVALGPSGNRTVVATALAAGSKHTCAIVAAGRIKCWGKNRSGQLGLGDNITRGTDPAQMGAALPFVDLGPGLAAVALAAGDAHTCAVLQPGGRVKCWGNNTAGQLGLGDNRTRGLRPTDMGAALPFVDLGPGLNATAIAAGSRHTCVLLQPGGRVKCWGSNDRGQLGMGDKRSRGLLPSEMGALLPFVDLGSGLEVTQLVTGAGAAHTCALLQPGSLLKCWGADDVGQLGAQRIGSSTGDEPGEMGAFLKPVVLSPDVTRFKSAAVSTYLTCAVVDTTTQQDQVKCWGAVLDKIPGAVIRGNPTRQRVFNPKLGLTGDLSEDIKRSPLLDSPPSKQLQQPLHCQHRGPRRVDLRLRVPPEELLRAAEKTVQQSTWGLMSLEDLGITFRGVPHLRIVDSVISGMEFSLLGPLLADIRGFKCTSVLNAHGWSCLHLQYSDASNGDNGVDNGSSLVSPELQQWYDTAAGQGFLTITNSSFVNTKTGWGGMYGAGDAASVDAYKAPLVREAAGALQIRVYDSVFTDHKGVALTVLGSSQDYVELSRCVMSRNEARSGPVLYIDGSLSGLTLKSVQVADNTATGDRGGVAFVSGSLDQLIVFTSNFTNNSAAMGGMLYTPYVDRVRIVDSTLTVPDAVLYGGIIAANGMGDISVMRSLISGNRAFSDNTTLWHTTNGFNSITVNASTITRGNI
ncbi:hypothetical protein VOLCADRAFT_91374 [Volvox carteri f. nagariensis]|uniref:Uncharacterized protein n=1 Tax=Volvox carteri f. nagariensis TaxID=3068 RepID=D8TWW7_VOLCA|nr:uncharacterized protein VOLCADRAFT_91374 [Volvox carteri f. nagariensis]EFJ48225.1 hypothetical protein VOLCADRAFT_91374 [Volvox carteri f. nagariensis]|eukprot:XP_002950910.1 hypothetical protein VOLCADRAFT_91374 [Volvox carteri f. nagariensis]